MKIFGYFRIHLPSCKIWFDTISCQNQNEYKLTIDRWNNQITGDQIWIYISLPKLSLVKC